MVFRKLWEWLTQLSPEAQAVLDTEKQRLQVEWEAIQRQIMNSRDAALAADQKAHQERLSSEYQDAITTAIQKITSSAEEAINLIAQYPTNISNERFERLSRRRKLDSLIHQTTRDIDRVNRPLEAFDSSVVWVTRLIEVWWEVPQDILDDIEAKRQALLLAQENKIRELQSIKAEYEAELEELKSWK